MPDKSAGLRPVLTPGLPILLSYYQFHLNFGSLRLPCGSPNFRQLNSISAFTFFAGVTKTISQMKFVTIRVTKIIFQIKIVTTRVTKNISEMKIVTIRVTKRISQMKIVTLCISFCCRSGDHAAAAHGLENNLALVRDPTNHFFSALCC